jgi:AraC-like DNA-binding protein
MGEDSCAPYPHFTWLAHWLSVVAPRVFNVHQCRHVTHHLLLTISGDAAIQWETRGVKTVFHAATGGVGFFPCDLQSHTMSITTAVGFEAYDVMLPEWQVQRVCNDEGLRPIKDVTAVPSFRDALMQASLLRLSARIEGRQISEEIGDEIAARQIILQLCMLVGGQRPEWRKDTSVFTPHSMRQIVADIDGHLGMPQNLECMGKAVGLSPGHFARKFHHSAGESLGRFVNRRRVGASFAVLRGSGQPLSQVALDLGFSSQSHFTRVFSGLTGTSPDQFRRSHRRASA